MDNRPIGLFDSGVGGLTVVKQVIKTMPYEATVYFGDTARVPYGSKSKETVTKFSKQIIKFLLSQNVKAIIIACNTVSSNCYEELCESFPDIHIEEVVTSGAESAAKVTENGIIGVIGTEATVRSCAYEKKIKNINKDLEVYSKACPLFVPLAEEGWTDNSVAKETSTIYLSELMDKGIDSIVLGCTHYPILKKCIGETVGSGVKIVDPANVTALKMKSYLEENDMLSGIDHTGRHTFFVSDNTSKFSLICKTALKTEYKANKIDIEKY